MSSVHRFVHPDLFDTPHVFVRANSDELGADISGTDNLYMFNWLDTAGHQYGILVFRWVGPRKAITALPTARLVPLSELSSVPADGAAGHAK